MLRRELARADGGPVVQVHIGSRIGLEPRCPLQGGESVVLRQDQHESAATAMVQPVREGEVGMTAFLRAGHDHEPPVIAEVGETFRAMPIPQSGDANPFSEHRRLLRVNTPAALRCIRLVFAGSG